MSACATAAAAGARVTARRQRRRAGTAPCDARRAPALSTAWGQAPSAVCKPWRALLAKGAHALFGVGVRIHAFAQLLLVGDHAVPRVAQVVGDRLAGCR